MTTDRATWDAEVEAVARRLAQHVFTEDVADYSMCTCGIPATDHDTVLAQHVTTYASWFDPGVMGPRDEDRHDYDPREDCDPGGHEADAAASRLYGGRP